MPDIASKITTDELKNMLSSQEHLVVDTLPPEHFERRHIPGARQACVYEVNFLQQITDLGATPETPIALYGAGPLSQDCLCAANKLLQAGFSNVFIYRDGLEGWRNAGYSLEGTAPDEVDAPHPELTLEQERYTLLPAECAFTWIGRNNNGRHWGTLLVSEGHLEKKQGGDGQELEGQFQLDMHSIRNHDLEGDAMRPVLEEHLKSDDFFFSQSFPTATFTIDSMRPITESCATTANFAVEGELALRGLKRKVAFDAQLRNVADGRLGFMAHFDLDRTRWGVIYGSARFFHHLSYHLVWDTISIEFRLILD